MIVTKGLEYGETHGYSGAGRENYSYMKCPDCGRKIEVFGKGRIEEIAKETGLALAGQIPIRRSARRKLMREQVR